LLYISLGREVGGSAPAGGSTPLVSTGVPSGGRKYTLADLRPYVEYALL